MQDLLAGSLQAKAQGMAPTPSAPPKPKQTPLFTPQFLEEQRSQGIGDDTVADYLAAQNPAFRSQLMTIKQKSGNDPRAITAFLNYRMYGDTAGPPQQEEKGFFGRVGETIQERAVGMGEAFERGREGKQTLAETAYQTAGQFAGAAGDALVGGAKQVVYLASALTPDAIEEPVVEAVKGMGQQALESASGQYLAGKAGDVAGGYEEWKKKHPRAAANLEATIDIASFIPIGKVGKIGKEAVEQGVKGAAKAAAKTTAKVTGKAFNAERRIQKLVMPDVTKKLIQETGKKSAKLVDDKWYRLTRLRPNEAQVRLKETAKTIEGFGKSGNVYKNARIIEAAKERESKALLKRLRSNDAVLPHKQVDAQVRNALEEIALDFPGEEKIVQRMGKIWEEVSKGKLGTLSGQWERRIDFDQLVKSRFKEKIFEQGTARAESVRAVRQTVNGLIDEGARKAGMQFTPVIDRLSDMYDILENLSTKMGTSGPIRKALKSPLGKTLGTAALGATAYEAIR